MSEAVGPYVPLVRLFRAEQDESEHHGAFVLLDGGAIRTAGGDVHRPIFLRSALKPIQALAGVTTGAVARLGLHPRALAVACGSHTAAPVHLAAVREVLERAGLDESHLQCGGHWSFDRHIVRTQIATRPDEGFPAIWSNCSGKHALMLAGARALGAPVDTYLAHDHPVQLRIREAILGLAAPLDTSTFVSAVDGCSAPTYALPLATYAHALRRWGGMTEDATDVREVARQVREAALAYPVLVGGEGRFDTDLMRSTPGLFAKAGAEGVHITVVPDRDLVLLVKVADGGDRGYMAFVIDLLRRLDVLSDESARRLSAIHADPVLRNHAGAAVGRIEVLQPDL